MTVVGVIMVDNMAVVGDIVVGEEEAAEIGDMQRHLSGDDAASGEWGGPGHRFGGGARNARGRRGGGGRHRRRGGGGGGGGGGKTAQEEANDKFEKTAREGTGAVKYTGVAGQGPSLPEGAPGAGVSTAATAKDVPTRRATDKSPKMGGHLSGQRVRFAEEMKTNPQLKEHFLRMIQQEDPDDVGAQMEESMNRASARNRSLWDTLHNNPKYFPTTAGKAPTAETRQRFEEELPAVLAGSNRIKYATGNASLDVGVGRQTYKSKSGERYGVETADTTWADRMAREGAAGTEGGKFAAVAQHMMPRGFGPGSGATADMLPTSKLPEREARAGAEFPTTGESETGGHPNLSKVHPELIRRTNEAYRAAKAAGAHFSIVSGYRPAWKAEAKAMGMPESSSQEDIWNRATDYGQHAPSFAAARPGHSQHQQGKALDVRDPTGWLHRNASRFGLHFPVSGDYPHMQMIPDE